jgi:hypothetical protein
LTTCFSATLAERTRTVSKASGIYRQASKLPSSEQLITADCPPDLATTALQGADLVTAPHERDWVQYPRAFITTSTLPPTTATAKRSTKRISTV